MKLAEKARTLDLIHVCRLNVITFVASGCNHRWYNIYGATSSFSKKYAVESRRSSGFGAVSSLCLLTGAEREFVRIVREKTNFIICIINAEPVARYNLK